MTTKEFIAKLNCEDGAAIFEKIQAADKTPDAVYAIAKEAGVTDSFDVFKAEMTAQYEAMSLELNEDELATVAGGSFNDVLNYTGAGVGVVGIVAAAVSAAI